LLGALAALAVLTYAAGLAAAALLGVRLVRRLPLGRWVYPGQWAFALSRAAGVGVLGFLCVHVLDVALIPLAPDLYDRTVRGYAAPFLVPMEIALVAAVVYHALNGLRLMTLEALDARAARARTPSFVLVVIVTVLVVLPSLAVLLAARR
jgi:succinate dehydrogenase / fumarate reductase cytochrome b subunit